MVDQAEKLRQLARHEVRTERDRRPAGLIVVVGSQPGVGTSTFCLNFALSLVIRGTSLTLVDAGVPPSHLLSMCGVTCGRDLSELLQGHRTIRELMVAGPCGLEMVGGWPAAMVETQQTALLAHLTDAVQDLAETRPVIVHADLKSDWHALFQQATQIVLVTSPSKESLLSTYGGIKQVTQRPLTARFWTVVNQADDATLAAAVEQRIQRSCDQFLNLQVRGAGVLPADDEVPGAQQAGRPVLLHAPHSAYARAMASIVSRFELTTVQAAKQTHATPVTTSRAA